MYMACFRLALDCAVTSDQAGSLVLELSRYENMVWVDEEHESMMMLSHS